MISVLCCCRETTALFYICRSNENDHIVLFKYFTTLQLKLCSFAHTLNNLGIVSPKSSRFILYSVTPAAPLAYSGFDVSLTNLSVLYMNPEVVPGVINQRASILDIKDAAARDLVTAM